MSLFEGIDAVVFDVDGTLLHAAGPGGVEGAQPIPGALEAVSRARAAGLRVLFFTNGTGSPPARYAAELRAVGFELADDEFMNPAVVAARWIARRHPGASVLVLGGAGVVAPLRELGISVVDGRADVVLVGWDRTLTYDQLRAACDSVWSGAPLLATSTARAFAVDGGRAPGWSGSVVAGIRQATGAKALTLGKPSPETLREICRSLGVRPGRTLVVGDDLTLEIAMARRLGARCALVLTGISCRADVEALPPGRRPDAVAATIADLPCSRRRRGRDRHHAGMARPEHGGAEPASPVVACTLGAADLAAQAARWRRLRADAERELALTDDGVRAAYRDEPGVEGELRALVAVENDCCSWARWRVEREPGQVVLRVRSSGEGVPTLHAMFRRGAAPAGA